MESDEVRTALKIVLAFIRTAEAQLDIVYRGMPGGRIVSVNDALKAVKIARKVLVMHIDV